MGKFIDLCGNKYNYLTVLERSSDYISPSGKSRATRWLCRCDCGSTCVVVGSKLKNGHTKSCGRCNLASNFVDFTGRRFDKLLVIKQDGYYYYPDGERDAKWLCVCDCGNSITISGRSLRKKGNHSCNCYRSERRIMPEDMISKVFGRLTVLSESEPLFTKAGTRIDTWMCSCKCGSNIVVRGASLRNGKTKSCGCLRLELLAQSGFSSKSESFVEAWLNENNFEYIKQVTFSGLYGVSGNLLSYDFKVLIDDDVYLIECQGAQHYKPVDFFGGRQVYGRQKVHDFRKRKFAENKGYYLLEINCSKYSERLIEKSLIDFFNIPT